MRKKFFCFLFLEEMMSTLSYHWRKTYWEEGKRFFFHSNGVAVCDKPSREPQRGPNVDFINSGKIWASDEINFIFYPPSQRDKPIVKIPQPLSQNNNRKAENAWNLFKQKKKQTKKRKDRGWDYETWVFVGFFRN